MRQSATKTVLRKQMLQKRRALDKDFIKKSEESFLEIINHFSFYQDAKTIMFYMDFQNEAPTRALLKNALLKNKNIVLPLTDKNFKIIPYKLGGEEILITSALGISEPDPLTCSVADPKEIDVVLIPGVVFDRMGNRIGFGKGCYDAFLPQLRSDALKVGFSYDFQLLKRIPFEPRDIPMDFILTEKRIFKTIRS
ncbi:5-formyltetrahydrofolate cyclo-ligase [Sinanaerobacter sp. ZZT-01]|uniref:5-formyltetrahydrofolate cyclo-ligase n=1 Tax=Sinanaerobacter sp. ZZT-01 TaxID=3111540 RepID=UPI002D7796B4|nr:5-formyltetrahydrofolate cyclo-ligase [Sinanaerobacter sp. ZZT-01]WRR93495.1 5-formyltetrahydrofolate cyclo-ligase [Sinanaerobacter sp. ZZT-01]